MSPCCRSSLRPRVVRAGNSVRCCGWLLVNECRNAGEYVMDKLLREVHEGRLSLHNTPLSKPGVCLTTIKRLLEECLQSACAMSYCRGCVSLNVADILIGKRPRGTKGRRMQPCDSKGPIGPGVIVECELQVVFFVWSVIECCYWLAARDGQR
jgi:hypothetical protein